MIALLKERPFYIVGAVLVLAFALRIWGIGSMDLQGDGAHYAFRALGWFDSLITEAGQTTPLNWFGYRPWWSYLSFHDHPPLGFAILHVFFRLFGIRTFVVSLPYLIAGVATAFFLYRFSRKYTDAAAALIAVTLYAVASYAIWGSRTAYLEGIEVLFLILAFFGMVRFFETKKLRDALLWSLFLGLALLTKYTAIFLIGGAALYILLWRGEWILKSWRLWFGASLTTLILLPAIIFNAMVLQTRGHFDAALSAMLGQKPEDFAYITGSGGFKLSSLLSPALTLYSHLSLPFFIVVIASLAWFLVRVFRNRDTSIMSRMLATSLIALYGMFAVSGSSGRYLTIAMPFLALVTALALRALWNAARTAGMKRLIAGGTCLIITMELLYAINTNILVRPIGTRGIAYASERLNRTGFEAVDQYILTEIYPVLPRLDVMREYPLPKIEQYDVILVDERGDWFSGLWYYKRYLFYRLPVITIKDLATLWRSEGSPGDMLQFLSRRGAHRIWFIYPTKKAQIRNADESYVSFVENMRSQLQEQKREPVLFRDYVGDPVFELYFFEI